jgi:multicomponent Na+:H+ antiporter subunit G
MTEWIIIFLSTVGALFIFLAAVGLVRMPDFYLRVSVTTKAVTLGVGLVLVSAATYFNDISVTSRVTAIILFLFLTAPVAAHVITRAAYFTGTKLWKKSIIDDLKGRYQDKTISLEEEEEGINSSPSEKKASKSKETPPEQDSSR